MLNISYKQPNEAPFQKPPQKPPKKTARATAARRAAYDEKVKAALLHLQEARDNGAKNAKEFAEYLNSLGVPAPSGGRWRVDAVLRCLRRLKALGLDKGSRPAHEARRRRPYRLRTRPSQTARRLLRTVPPALLREVDAEVLGDAPEASDPPT